MATFLDHNLSNSVYPSDTVNLVGIQGSKDEGKPVKLTGSSEFTLVSDGDSIDGLIFSVDSVRQDGSIIGTVKRQPLLRTRAVNTGVTQLTVGATVLAAAQIAAGTEGYPQVKAGAGNWRVIELLDGTGLQTETVVIEKV